MPQKTRRPSAQQRANRRKRQAAVVMPAPRIGTPPPTPGPTPTPPSEAIQEASTTPPPAAAATLPQPASKSALTLRGGVRPLLHQNPTLVTELQRIGILTAVLFSVLIVLSFLFR